MKENKYNVRPTNLSKLTLNLGKTFPRTTKGTYPSISQRYKLKAM